MIVRVVAFANFRDILGKDLKVDLEEGSTVRALIDNLSASHPALRSAIFDNSNQIREYVILMKNKKNIESVSGLETKLSDGDEVAILPPVAGG
ncbi:MAG: MoaD family protein [Methanothrix sp.]|nr:MoaD family protein [Methanothrix sp.]